MSTAHALIRCFCWPTRLLAKLSLGCCLTAALSAAALQQPCLPFQMPAVLETLAAYEAQGLLSYTAVPVDSEGLVSAADVAASMREETCLVTLMHR